MSIYPNVTEQDLISLRNLAEQEKNKRALKIKDRSLKQTHDIKLAESLSPITKKLVEVNESTQNIGDVIKENNTPELAKQNTPTHQPIDNNEGVVYDVELENTLKNMTGNTGFFKTDYDHERGWMWNGHPIIISSGTQVEINGKKFNINPGFQNVSTDTSNIPLKKLNGKDNEILISILDCLDFDN